VVNFISSGSIEARILELLKFKKSVFAGALDQDGEDVVMIGESQMKRFLKTVDTLTEKIEKSDPLVEEQAQREAERDEALADRAEQLEREPKTGGVAGFPELEQGKGLEGLNALLVRGAEFLMNLSQTLTAPTWESATQYSPKDLSPVLERDAVSDVLFSYFSGVTVIMSRGIINFLMVLISASLRIVN